MQDFADKIAVVTGAASGIGEALTRVAASFGMRVLAADYNEKGVTQVSDELRAAGHQVIPTKVDVADKESVKSLAKLCLKQMGAAPDLLFNNAGVIVDGVTWERSLEDWQWVLGVNLFGVLHGIREFLPLMLQANKPAHVVNTASMGGLLTGPFLGPYTVSKHAVVALSECLRDDLQQQESKVSVSVVCPGGVRTALWECEEHRPATLGETTILGSESEHQFRQAVQETMSKGSDPQDIAQQIFAAIKAGKFWIFPHPEMLEGFRKRSEAILENG